MSREDRSLVDKVNEKIRELRESLADRFEDEEKEATLPLLSEPEGERDQGWWEENVEPLQQSIEEYRRKLERDDERHEGLRARLDVALDLLPDRENR